MSDVPTRETVPLIDKGEQPTQRWQRRPIILSMLFIILCAGYFSLVPPYLKWKRPPPPSHYDLTPELIWDKLESQDAMNLTWLKCYNNYFECARLEVPLDYSNLAQGYARIALLRYPAKVRRSHPDYKGPILFNPGGPGASGVTFILNKGPYFQELLGSEYDIVGFDPRGVARTIPQVRFFADKVEGIAYRTLIVEDPAFNTSEDAYSRFHARYTVLADIGHHQAQHSAPYVSTALVARDMLSMTQAFGYDKLKYWGFSYGTVLGATYAAMFPDNVDRLVIDGVVDPNDYYKALWANNLVDTDKGLRTFFQECVDAGPDKCAIYEHTAQEVHLRIHRTLDGLKKDPVPVTLPNSTRSGYRVPYGLIDYKIAKTVLFYFLHSPYVPNTFTAASNLAKALRDIEKGDGTAMLLIWGGLGERTVCASIPSGWPQPPIGVAPDAGQAIMCGDGDEVHDTVADVKQRVELMAKDSEFADIFETRGTCVGWKTRPVERFLGPFVANTSFPLLIIGNTADPVTPLANAHIVSEGFYGSVVLTQDSCGHCSIQSLSFCTARAIRAYFRDGKMPPSGTVCGVTSKMFRYEGVENDDDLVERDYSLIRACEGLRIRANIPYLGSAIQRADVLNTIYP